jgi:hypothetical protein
VKPRVTARGVGRPSLRAFVRTGLRVRVGCPAGCRVSVRIVVSRQSARRLHAGRTIARVRRTISAGAPVTLRLRPPRRVVRNMRHLKRLRAVLRVDATDATGAASHTRERVVLGPDSRSAR